MRILTSNKRIFSIIASLGEINNRQCSERVETKVFGAEVEWKNFHLFGTKEIRMVRKEERWSS